ncbi:uncharacterized protein METZ01_LOCUS351973, partial [marine metagenome]
GMVGLIDKPEHITSQWFKDNGDAIILLGQAVNGNDPLLGLGGSALVQIEHGRKEGTPPPCDLARESALHDTLLGLIATGAVKSAHDCAEGGLAVALAECCISQLIARSTPRLTGAALDLAGLDGVRVDALLFGESHGRVVITTSEAEAGAAVERAGLFGVPAVRVGTVTGSDTLDIAVGETHFSWELNELHDLWWNTIARAMQQ